MLKEFDTIPRSHNGELEMSISKTHSKKSPSQNPVAFYKSEKFGGADGRSTQKVPDKLTGGPQREQIYGRKDLGKQ